MMKCYMTVVLSGNHGKWENAKRDVSFESTFGKKVYKIAVLEISFSQFGCNRRSPFSIPGNFGISRSQIPGSGTQLLGKLPVSIWDLQIPDPWIATEDLGSDPK